MKEREKMKKKCFVNVRRREYEKSTFSLNNINFRTNNGIINAPFFNINKLEDSTDNQLTEPNISNIYLSRELKSPDKVFNRNAESEIDKKLKFIYIKKF